MVSVTTRDWLQDRAKLLFEIWQAASNQLLPDFVWNLVDINVPSQHTHVRAYMEPEVLYWDWLWTVLCYPNCFHGFCDTKDFCLSSQGSHISLLTMNPSNHVKNVHKVFWCRVSFWICLTGDTCPSGFLGESWKWCMQHKCQIAVMEGWQSWDGNVFFRIPKQKIIFYFFPP